MAVSKGKIVLWVVVGIVALLVLYTIFAYNRFVTLDQNINSKWSEVENQYQRQYDLFGNIASVITSAVGVETKFVKDVVAARTGYANAQSQLAKDTAGVQMTNGISALVNAVAENYPVLQANGQYKQFVDEISGTQNRITTARGRYIEAIQLYNVATMRFPSNVFAKMFGFGGREYYSAQLEAMKTPVLGTGTLPQ